MTQPESTYNHNDFECPFCHEEMGDSWEHKREEDIELECGNCEKTFFGRAEVSVSYSAWAPPEATNEA